MRISDLLGDDDDVIDAQVIETHVVETESIDAPVIDMLVADLPVIDAPGIDMPVADVPVIETPGPTGPVAIPGTTPARVLPRWHDTADRAPAAQPLPAAGTDTGTVTDTDTGTVTDTETEADVIELPSPAPDASDAPLPPASSAPTRRFAMEQWLEWTGQDAPTRRSTATNPPTATEDLGAPAPAPPSSPAEFAAAPSTAPSAAPAPTGAPTSMTPESPVDHGRATSSDAPLPVVATHATPAAIVANDDEPTFTSPVDDLLPAPTTRRRLFRRSAR